jgi:hypothetical protein
MTSLSPSAVEVDAGVPRAAFSPLHRDHLLARNVNDRDSGDETGDRYGSDSSKNNRVVNPFTEFVAQQQGRPHQQQESSYSESGDGASGDVTDYNPFDDFESEPLLDYVPGNRSTVNAASDDTVMDSPTQLPESADTLNADSPSAPPLDSMDIYLVPDHEVETVVQSISPTNKRVGTVASPLSPIDASRFKRPASAGPVEYCSPVTYVEATAILHDEDGNDNMGCNYGTVEAVNPSCNPFDDEDGMIHDVGVGTEVALAASTNPFGDDEEDVCRTPESFVVTAINTTISTNPFDHDADGADDTGGSDRYTLNISVDIKLPKKVKSPVPTTRTKSITAATVSAPSSSASASLGMHAVSLTATTRVNHRDLKR